MPPPVSTRPAAESYNAPPVDRDAPPPAGSAAAMGTPTGATAAPPAASQARRRAVERRGEDNVVLFEEAGQDHEEFKLELEAKAKKGVKK